MAQPDTAIERARDAAARGAWAEAYEAFHAADRSTLAGADLEALADAAWWVSRFEESIDARQRAYAAFDADGDDVGAAGAAARLAIEHFVRGTPSVGAGYLQRAHRHAEGQPDRAELGFLALVDATVAQFSGDVDRAVVLSREAIEVGRRFGDRDLVAMAIHTEGLAMIDAGRVGEGLALLDEAMAAVLAGDLSPYFTGIIYCSLIAACLQLNDVKRAGEWSDAATTWCETLPSEAPFPGMCRLNRSEVAHLRGAWPQAEAEAVRASEELAALEPGLAAAAFVQLGEIRRHLGDTAGAEAAFVRAQELGGRPQPGLALLRLAQGKVEAARTGLTLALAAEHQRSQRVRLLSAQVEVDIVAGELGEARAAADEIDALARETGTPSFAAPADTATGAVSLAEGDALAGLDRLRAACAAWQELRLPYEVARTRVLCAQATRAAGDEEGARHELGAALAEFRRLGAVPDADAVERLLGEPVTLPGGLTPREAEVLRLVASGKTNRDIAVELVISEHTVARHLQNMFAKLGVSSRSAATAYAFEHGLT